jgi:hypothetical protein
MVAVSNGNVSPTDGKMLIDLIATYVGLADIETVLAELRKIKRGRSDSKLPAGHVMFTDPALIDGKLIQ